MMKHVYRGMMVFAAGLALLCGGGMALAGSTGAQKCQADKIKRAGWYNFCRMKAESKGLKKSKAPDFTKCDEKIVDKFGKLETRWGAQCPTSGDVGDIQGQITVDTDVLVAVLTGTRVSECQPCSLFPATGQTTSYGTGSDGDVQAGATLSYTDNGDGTITDNNTGLVWEKKDDWGGIHDKDNTYTWGTASTMDGTMATTFLATLNTPDCFAGHCDWRIPNVKELQSIVDYEVPYPGPTVSGAFNASCATGCTVDGMNGPMCSCTPTSYSWSSTTYTYTLNLAWVLDFGAGSVTLNDKDFGGSVRAVRGGL